MAETLISYRREDAAPYAGRLHDHLVREFGRKKVFIDLDTIDPGEGFKDVIKSAVNRKYKVRLARTDEYGLSVKLVRGSVAGERSVLSLNELARLRLSG